MTGRWPPRVLLLLASLSAVTGVPVDALAQGQDSSILAHFLSEGRTDQTAEALSAVSSPRRLVRRDLDLTGDGVSEVFLSEEGQGSRAQGRRWQVYDVSNPARFRQLGSVSFHESFVRITGPGELRALYQGGGLGKVWLVDYQWTGSEIVEVQRVLLEDGPELTAEKLETRRFQERLPEWPPWAEVTSRGLGPWIDPSTEGVVRDLAPIAPQHFSALAEARVGPPSLLEDLGERLSCPQERCELIVELADLTDDGGPELIFHSSNFTGAPRPVYAKAAEGYRYLGGLPTGLWRLDEQKRLVVVKVAPLALARYRVTSEELILLEELTLPAGRLEIEREQRIMADDLPGRDPHGAFFRVAWSEAAGIPESPAWRTFRTREPAEIEVDLSLPVANLETEGGS